MSGDYAETYADKMRPSFLFGMHLSGNWVSGSFGFDKGTEFVFMTLPLMGKFLILKDAHKTDKVTVFS